MDRSPFAPESWAELNRLLDAALDLPAAERQAWLETLPDEQAAIKPRLQALLMRSAQIETGDFLRALPRIGVSKKEEAALRPLTGHAGDAIGPYRLIRELGSGGMGAVWLAVRTDGLLHRPVALKLPHVSLRHANLAERMAREREILEGLSHPHIARLYDAGVTDEGQPYLALECVEGIAVDEYCLARGLDLRQRLRLFLQIAGAVAYAHGKLVVHRDLKPANVLVTSEGDVRLLDFGIAKLLEEGRTYETVLTQFVGPAFTPDFASPEQIRGEQLGIGSDIYSLGVILFRLVTGERPYRLDRESRGALEDAVLKAEPVRPSEVSAPALRRELRGDVDTIILKCLKKSPHERYATVHALAEDIERYLDGRPVLAQPDTAAYRLRKFVARNKLPVAAAAAVVVAILAGAGAAVWQARLALAEQKRAEEVKEFIAAIFRDANPYAEEGKAMSASELLHRAKEQVDALGTPRPALRVELLNLVGSSLMGLGDTAGAESVGTEALAESLRLLGPDHAQTVQARLLMVDVHRFRGRTPAMDQELALLKPIVTRAADARPVDLVRTLVDDAHLAVDEGRQHDAVAAAKEALDVATARLGKRHRETAAAATILAESSVMLADSRMSKAADRAQVLQTADLALDLVIHAYPGQPRHPQVLQMRATHGRALARAGYQYHRAIAELTEVLNDQR
ncbi:MAG: protein kinase domain-containing protein, partial [Steroidobacteraceae bacterium]